MRVSTTFSEEVYLPLFTTVRQTERNLKGNLYVGQMVGGWTFPRLSVGAALVYMIGRSLFSFGYIHRGPKGRILGGILSDLSLLSLTGAAIVTGCILSGFGEPAFISKIFSRK
jgi:hypothetical protein